VRVIHSNKGQNSRINAVNEFKEGKLRVLVSTDVTARGIDVVKVSHVINFDVPILYEDYVHRIGRTGRAFQDGKAITFVNRAEESHIEKIEKLIREKIPFKELPEGVFVEKTPFEEKQAIAKSIDDQKRREDPTFKGAFHEKKEPKKEIKVYKKTRKKDSKKDAKRDYYKKGVKVVVKEFKEGSKRAIKKKTR
jgi:ATP-dependent RNA helicase RhlE